MTRRARPMRIAKVRVVFIYFLPNV